jgi:hypothetical protein
MSAVYFAVERTPTGEQAALYYDELPSQWRGQNATKNGLLYALRLDNLPNASAWLRMPLNELYEVYCRQRDKGSLS